VGQAAAVLIGGSGRLLRVERRGEGGEVG
jgi:hypothetical protein